MGLSRRGACLPIYEYQCRKCGQRVEKIQKFTDPPLTTCKKCRGTLQRLLSSPAIQFKGSGWYVTDYARKSTAPSKSEGSDGGAEKKAAEPAKEAATSKSKASTD
jgi:putative FmdB family regulatory protein